MGGGPPVWAGLRVRLMAPARLVWGSFTVLAVNSNATNGNCAGVTGIFRANPALTGVGSPAGQGCAAGRCTP